MLGCATMAKMAESVSITARTLESSVGVFQLANVVGVRTGVARGSFAARWIGVMSMLIAIGYGGCFLLADALSGGSDGVLTVELMFFGGFALFGWSKWLAPPRYQVLLHAGGSEVAVAEYREAANADRVVGAVRDAMSKLNA